jgi:hemoglobin-like flavoprotein
MVLMLACRLHLSVKPCSWQGSNQEICMLTERQREIVKATVPLLETGGEALITHFYQTMLGEYPEVRPLFNQAHQQSGAQPALWHTAC